MLADLPLGAKSVEAPDHIPFLYGAYQFRQSYIKEVEKSLTNYAERIKDNAEYLAQLSGLHSKPRLPELCHSPLR
jgi:hypothetical protein